MAFVTDINDLDPAGTYSYADYLKWRFEEYVELFRGKVMRMSPAPLRHHQWIAGNIHSLIHHYLRRKPCDVYIAPFDVRLPKTSGQTGDATIYTVVQPDVCIVCDRSKLDDRGCIGAPDTVIEIVSKGNAKRDLHQKMELYAEHGVPEYWIVFPGEKIVLTHILRDGRYEAEGEYAEAGPIPLRSLPGFEMEWTEIFE